MRVSSLISISIFSFLLAPGSSLAQTVEGDTAKDLEEVVVTGLKRNLKFEEVPVSVSVFTESDIAKAGISKPADYLVLTPNVNFNQADYQSDFYINIRGQASIRGAEPSVAIVVDGVPLGSEAEFNAALFDLQQIEILKGPQGALYGRNASAGAIIVSTKEPAGNFEGNASVGYGSWNSYLAKAGVGGAIAPGILDFRAGASVTGTDGAYTNVNTGEKSHRYQETSGRARLKFTPNEKFGADLVVTALHANGASSSGFTPKLVGTVVGGVPVDDVSSNHNIDIPFVSDVPGRYVRDIFGASLKMGYQFDNFELTSISAWSQSIESMGGKNFPYGNPADSSTDFDFWAPIFGDLTQNYRFSHNVFNQEFRVTSKDTGPIRWQVGAQYIDKSYIRLTVNGLNGAIPPALQAGDLTGFVGYDAMGDRVLIGGGATIPDTPFRILGIDSATPVVAIFNENRYDYNISPFANIQWDMTDSLKLGVAARYDTEHRRIASKGPDEPNPFAGGESYNPCVAITGRTEADCRDGDSKTFHQLQPKISLNYHKMGSPVSGFASWGQGFKTGGWNPIGTRETMIASRVPIFIALGQTPEDARASAEAVTFTQDFYDKEVSDNYEIGFKSRLFGGRVTLNGAVFYIESKNAQQYRFDAIAFIQAVDGIDKVTTKGYEFDGTVNVTHWLSLFGGFGHIDSEVKGLEADPSLIGNTAPYAPEYNMFAGFQVDRPVNANLNVTARAQYTLTGPVWYDVQNTPETRRDEVGLLDARLGISSERWELNLWAKNLLDKKYVSEAVVLLPYLSVLYKAPTRQFGLEGTVRF